MIFKHLPNAWAKKLTKTKTAVTNFQLYLHDAYMVCHSACAHEGRHHDEEYVGRPQRGAELNPQGIRVGRHHRGSYTTKSRCSEHGGLNYSNHAPSLKNRIH